MIIILLFYSSCLLLCTATLLDIMKWLGMIIYLASCLYFLLLLNVLIFTGELIDCELCILLHSWLLLSIFGMKRDSLRNTALLGYFSHSIFLVFPDSRICHNNGDKSSTRSCLYEEGNYTAELYFLKY